MFLYIYVIDSLMHFGIGKFGVHFIFCVLNDVIGCDAKIKHILICRFVHLTAAHLCLKDEGSET